MRLLWWFLWAWSGHRPEEVEGLRGLGQVSGFETPDERRGSQREERISG